MYLGNVRSRPGMLAWLACMVSLATMSLGYAQDLSGNSLEEVVAQSEKVARIRITKRSQLRTESNAPCGYMYSARVVEAFKGGTSPFEFVAPTDQDFRDLDHEYLVIAFPHFDVTPETDAFLRHMLSPEEEDKVRCRMAARYYVPGAHRMLWSIDKDAGQEWLAPDTRPAVAWCVPGNAAGEVPGFRQVRVGDYVYDAVQWQVASKLIARALKAHPYKSGRTLDPNFRPGSCQN